MGETAITESFNKMHKILEVSYMKERDYFENLAIDGRRILKQITNKHSAIMEVAFICLGLVTVNGIL
jgi:hypothetical protein